MTLTLDDLATRSGHLLWRELPEEWRYRDAPPLEGELGDLGAFLHGMGHLLDLIRGTTEQLHADSFAEEITFDGPDGPYNRVIQPWVLPYLAQLIGAELQAPDPVQRVDELNHTVRWYKSKGTLTSIDELGDVLTGAETISREGWRLVVTAPRIALPPFTLDPVLVPSVDGRPQLPLGCPDFRRTDRAVQDPSGANPLYRIRQPRRDARGVETTPLEVYWKSRSLGGVPCFPGAYDDLLPRTPDLREPERTDAPGPHPRRVLIHVRPSDGLFAEGLAELSLPASALTPTPQDPALRLTPADLFLLANSGIPEGEPIPDRVRVNLATDVTVAAGRKLHLEGVLIIGAGKLRAAPGAQIIMERSAVSQVNLNGPGPVVQGEPQPALIARNSLFGQILAPTSFVRLEYVTVLTKTDAEILQASDSILGNLTDNFRCGAAVMDGPATCLRYSQAVPPPTPPSTNAQKKVCQATFSGSNTILPPHFAPRWHCGSTSDPALRIPAYGEVGCGVLSLRTAPEILAGAEDDGEMGAMHQFFLAAELAALLRKLQSFLPLGQEAALIADPMLARVPPQLTTTI